MTDAKPPAVPETAAGLPRVAVTFHAGRHNNGAFAVGTHATATAIISEMAPGNPVIDIAQTLQTLRAAFGEIPGVEVKALTRLEEASQEAAKPAPEAKEITTLVDQATRYATKAAGFASAVDKLAPHLKRVWDWAGSALPEWAASLGLR